MGPDPSPVSVEGSSFLVAGLETLMFTGNIEVVKKAYPGFEAWQKCLTMCSNDNVVDYSYYGDWAGPVYSCKNGDKSIDAVQSINAPGSFISTGFYYYNAKLLKKMAVFLGFDKKAEFYEKQMATIKETILKRWWNGEKARW